ncbi:MAG: hypothetical protein ACKOEC_05215, partial [Acidimicrobiia bacterium]
MDAVGILADQPARERESLLLGVAATRAGTNTSPVLSLKVLSRLSAGVAGEGTIANSNPKDRYE